MPALISNPVLDMCPRPPPIAVRSVASLGSRPIVARVLGYVQDYHNLSTEVFCSEIDVHTYEVRMHDGHV